MTLLELVAVVVIVNVLAAISYVSYGKYKKNARITEATSMVTEIRIGQERYKAETGEYAAISANKSALYPQYKYRKANQWGAACGTLCKPNVGWGEIGVSASAPVVFGYATVAGTAVCNPTCALGGSLKRRKSTVDMAAALDTLQNASKEPFYITRAALADKSEDPDEPAAQVVGSSFNNELVVDDED